MASHLPCQQCLAPIWIEYTAMQQWLTLSWKLEFSPSWRNCNSLSVCSISGSPNAANTLAVDWQGTYCVIPTQSFQDSGDNAYTIGFSQAPVYNNPIGYSLSWKDSGYNTNFPKPRSSLQTFSKTGTLPSYFSHQQSKSAVGGRHKHKPEIVTVATESEVATIFWPPFNITM